jgi:hypothetical protein
MSSDRRVSVLSANMLLASSRRRRITGMADNGRLGTSEDFTFSEVAAACDIHRKAVEWRLRLGEFPNAWRGH